MSGKPCMRPTLRGAIQGEHRLTRKSLNYYGGREFFINLRRPDRELNAKGSLVGDTKSRPARDSGNLEPNDRESKGLCIGSYGEKGTHSSAIFGAVECFCSLARKTRSSYLLVPPSTAPPPRVLPDSTGVLCQLRNESTIHLVQGNTRA